MITVGLLLTFGGLAITAMWRAGNRHTTVMPMVMPMTVPVR